MSDPDRQPVLDAIGRDLVAGIATFERRRRHRRRVAGGVVAAGLLMAGSAGGLALLTGRQGDGGAAVSAGPPASVDGAGTSATGLSTSTVAPATGPLRLVDRYRAPLLPDDPTTEDLYSWVRNQLVIDPRYLAGDVEGRMALADDGGIEVRLTIDATAQQLAIEAREEVLRQEAGLDPAYAGVVVAVDPASGEVLALVGDNDQLSERYGLEAGFNLAADGAPSLGSAFIPVVLATAFGPGGLTPADVVDGRGPCQFANPGSSPDPYEVDNFYGHEGRMGPISGEIRPGSACALVRLGEELGSDRVAAMAADLGLGVVGAYPSLPLGSAVATPLQVASAYGVLAAGGGRSETHVIDRITQGDQTLYSHQPTAPVTALDAGAACRVTEVLAATARPEAALGGQPSAGVVGVGQAPSDAWYAGYTPYLATTVWVGDPLMALQPSGQGPPGADQPLERQDGYDDLATRIWARFNQAYRDQLHPTAVPLLTCAPD